MKKILSIIIVFVMCLSFTACKDNTVKYIILTSDLATDSFEFLDGPSPDSSDFSMEIDVKKLTIKYGRGNRTYTGTLEYYDENDDHINYLITWNSSPIIVDGFETQYTLLTCSPEIDEADTVTLYSFLEGQLKGITVGLHSYETWYAVS